MVTHCQGESVLDTGSSFQNCTTFANYTWSSGTSSSQDTYPNLVLDQRYAIIFSSVAAGASLVHTNTMGLGCIDGEIGYAESVYYHTDSSDVGPYYFTGFVQPPSSLSTNTTIASIAPSTLTGLTIRSLRGAVNGGLSPTGCTTWPSIAVKVGLTTESATFNASGSDPTWTGTLSVPSGSDVKLVYTPGSGCSGSVQFTAIVSYSIP